MRSGFRFVALTIFLTGLFLTGLVGTSTSMTFLWPVYLLLGIAATLLIATTFSPVGFHAPRWTTISLLALGFYLLIRAADSPVGYFAREDVGLIVASLIAYVGFLCICPTASSRKTILFVAAALVGVNLVLALLQHLVDPANWLLPGYERSNVTGVGGLFNQPDHFSTFLAVLLPLWISLLVFGRDHGLTRFLWSFLAFSSSAAILLTGNLSGMLVAGAGLGVFGVLVVFVVWKRLKPSVRRFALGGLAVVSLLLTGTFWLSSDAIGRELGGGTLAGSGKANLPLVWDSGWRLFEQSPLLGAGSRSSYIYSRTFRSPELGPEVGEPEFFHNEYLQMLADYGAVGLLLLLIVLFFHVRSGMRFLSAFQSVKGAPGKILPRSQHLSTIAGILSLLAALGLSAFFDFSLHLPVFALIAAIGLAWLAVPDPMAKVLSKQSQRDFLPGGSLLFSLRGIGFGCGLAMISFGSVFSRSEYHYEMARLAFGEDRRNSQQFRHLQQARKLDPQNPYIHTLIAHAQVAGITSDMALPARTEALETANRYFATARLLYPQDVFAAIGHAAVLDELGHVEEARDRLSEARQWAPLYGNLMLAEAEHHLRRGDVNRAEESYRKSLASTAFRDPAAAEEGLRTVSEWKMIARQEGIYRDQPDSVHPGPGDSRSKETTPLDALQVERDLAGESVPPENGGEELPESADWESPTDSKHPEP